MQTWEKTKLHWRKSAVDIAGGGGGGGGDDDANVSYGQRHRTCKRRYVQQMNIRSVRRRICTRDSGLLSSTWSISSVLQSTHVVHVSPLHCCDNFWQNSHTVCRVHQSLCIIVNFVIILSFNLNRVCSFSLCELRDLCLQHDIYTRNVLVL